MSNTKWNENKLTLSDIITYTFNQLEEVNGIKIPKSKQKDLFIEALTRNIVLNELQDMVLYIADNDKFFEMKEGE